MIRFTCPACQKILKVPDQGAGRKTSCPKCGQRMLIPQPEKPAARNRTVLGQLTSSIPSSLPQTEASVSSESESLALLGLRKDSELEAKTEAQLAYKPAGSWIGTALAALALALAVAAIPVAIVHHPLFGAGLAGLGLFFGSLGLFVAVKRRGAGCSLSLAGMAICGSILFTTLMLLKKDVASDSRRAQADDERQIDKDAKVRARELERDADPAEPNRHAGKNGDIPKQRPHDDPAEPNRHAGKNGDVPKQGRRRHEEEESPTERRSKRPTLFRTEVDRLIDQLKSEKTENRVAAAERLRKMGEKARPAIRALCEAIVSPTESVRRAALEALEKVDPALYKQVVLLVVDENASNHFQASKELAAMGTEGAAAVPVLLAHAKKVSSASNRSFVYYHLQLLEADIAALAKLGPSDSEVVKFFIELTKFTPGARTRPAAQAIRRAAFNALAEIGKSQPNRRKELMPMFIAALDDAALRINAIYALGNFGKAAKAAIPKLKDLKLSKSMAERDAARAALEKIEKDVEG